MKVLVCVCFRASVVIKGGDLAYFVFGLYFGRGAVEMGRNLKQNRETFPFAVVFDINLIIFQLNFTQVLIVD